MLDPKTVHRLEKELCEAIADVADRLGHERLPFVPSRYTVQMMAKAAAAVYEATEEAQRR